MRGVDGRVAVHDGGYMMAFRHRLPAWSAPLTGLILCALWLSVAMLAGGVLIVLWCAVALVHGLRGLMSRARRPRPRAATLDGEYTVVAVDVEQRAPSDSQSAP
jgi:hypothetical protein